MRKQLAVEPLPGRAEAFLAELPGAFGFGAGLGHRLARHLAIRREHHLELDIRHRRRRERLTVEERRLDVFRCKPRGKSRRDRGNDDHAAHE